MSTIVQLLQGSPEWLAYRRTLRNASESPAVLGVSPWVTPYQLWLSKTGRDEPQTNAAMRHGSALEPLARHAYEVETGHVMQPLVLQDGPYSASLDGMTLGGELIVEIKAPVRGQQSSLWRAVAGGEVPEHYFVQIQHQLMVSAALAAHLWVFDGERGLLREIRPDAATFDRIRAGWEDFAVYLQADVPPPLSEADTATRNDTPWLDAAAVYLSAKQQADAAAAALAAARENLTALSRHPRESGGGVSVTRYWKAGSVDYKRVPELQGVDLDRYRAAAREEVRIGLEAR